MKTRQEVQRAHDLMLCLSCTMNCAREVVHGSQCQHRKHAKVSSLEWRARAELVAVSMPGATTAWFLYEPIRHVPLAEGELVAAYDGRVLNLAWTEEYNQ